KALPATRRNATMRPYELECCSTLELDPLRAAAPLGRGPGDDLIRVHYVAGLAVDAVAGVDLQPQPAPLLRDHFIDRRRAEALARVAVLDGAAVLADRRVGDLEVRGLVLLVPRPGMEDVGETIEGVPAVGAIAVAVRRGLRPIAQPLQPLVPRFGRERVDETAPSGDLLQARVEESRQEPAAQPGVQIAHAAQ